MTRWTQLYFTEYLSRIGGLFTALLAIARFAVSGYQRFVASKSMLKRLYGEEDFIAADETRKSMQLQPQTPKETLRAKIEKTKDFNASYCAFMMVACFKALCCCFKPCCRGKCRRHLDSHRKFQIAQERLSSEVDIQHMIEMNRVTRLIHKAHFLQRHRRILAYSHKYVITGEDLNKEIQIDPRASNAINSKSESAQMIDSLINDFNAERNETDRRIFYEVTGRQLVQGEFDHEFTSDEEWGMLEAPDPLGHAFDYNSDLSDNENRASLIGKNRTRKKVANGEGKSPTTIN